MRHLQLSPKIMQNAPRHQQQFQGVSDQNCGRKFQDYLAWHPIPSEVYAHHASHFGGLEVTAPTVPELAHGYPFKYKLKFLKSDWKVYDRIRNVHIWSSLSDHECH